MRQGSLRQTANRYLKMDHRGSFKDKQHRVYVIHKMIDDLHIIGSVPASWRGLKFQHIHALVQRWKKLNIQPATIMRYMTVIRYFLNHIDCPIDGIDNKNLCLTRNYKRRNNTIKLQSDVWKTITEPCIRLIMALQTEFGLTFGEAIRFIPDIHYREQGLWITRDIAFNSEDRTIPVRNESQKEILTDLIIYTQGSDNLMQHHSYDKIRDQWRQTLTEYNLPTNKNFRYLYAQQLRAALSPIIGNYQIGWLIRDEMGIKSRNTLWLYLNE